MGKGKRREKDEEREIMRMMKEERRQSKEETQHKIAESKSMIQSIPLILSPGISAHLLLSLATGHLSLLANTCLCHSFS